MNARLGVVPYLNSVPLVRDLESDAHLELRSGTPAEIAEMLAAGAVDLGLVPVVEAARHRWHVVSGLGIVSRGPVRSVLLLSHLAPPLIRTLALDPASRTSAALVQLLLAHKFAVTPRITTGPRSGPALPDDVDAALLIGDRALDAIDPTFLVADLGTWWRELTGLPFVFAVWAGPDATVVAGLTQRLLAARDSALENLDAVVRDEAKRRSIGLADVHSYLSEAIFFDVGPAEVEGLTTFLDMLRVARMLDDDAQLGFV